MIPKWWRDTCGLLVEAIGIGVLNLVLSRDLIPCNCRLLAWTIAPGTQKLSSRVHFQSVILYITVLCIAHVTHLLMIVLIQWYGRFFT